MLDWLFGRDELPEGYEIRSALDNRDDTHYGLVLKGKVLAVENTHVYSHKTCLRRLRKAARLYAKNGVVPR